MPVPFSTGAVVRTAFAAATAAFAAVGLVLRDDPRWFVASGACGTMWLAWDLIHNHIVRPLGQWAAHVASGGAGASQWSARPDLDETVRFLEGHLQGPTSRRVQINAAIRLEEIYRLVRKDPDRARAVIRLVRARFPDAPELDRYDEGGSALGPRAED